LFGTGGGAAAARPCRRILGESVLCEQQRAGTGASAISIGTYRERSGNLVAVIMGRLISDVPSERVFAVSPVRMRSTCSIGLMKILPSPILSVRAACTIASSEVSSSFSGTTASTLIFGSRSTTYSAPRYNSVWPFLPTVTLDLGDGPVGHARLGEALRAPLRA